MNPMKSPLKLKTGIIIVLLVTFFVVLNLTAITKEVKNFFYLISLPIQKILWRIGDSTSDFFEAISEIKNLKRENEELKLKTQELLAENVAIIELKKENKILRETLEIGLAEDFKLVLADIIGKDISEDSILIDKGSKDGVLKDMPVVTQQKTLVGKISEAYKDFSKVMLISNKESSFDAKILAPYQTEGFGTGSDREIYGLVQGKGNFGLFLDLVPSDIKIEEGDILVTTSFGGIFPKGLLVGQIQKVKKSDIEPFQEAEIRPAFDIGELESLFIITKF